LFSKPDHVKSSSSKLTGQKYAPSVRSLPRTSNTYNENYKQDV
jgi:hypothetical protein